MAQVTATGIDENLVQEAIFGAATELNEATTHHWDENSFDINKSNIYSRVINTGGDCNADRLRPGHVQEALHRRCTDTNTPVSEAKLDDNVSAFEDLDQGSSNLFSDDAAQSGYKKAYTSALTISYPATFGSSGLADNDIKKLTVTVSDADGVVTVLSAYSCNIGEIDYWKRTMQ